VIRRVANSPEVAIIRERHGVQLDPHEAFSLDPEAPDGHRYELVQTYPHAGLSGWTWLLYRRADLTPAPPAQAHGPGSG